MIRKIIHIDAALCNGCGACAAACHEGAIEMVDGKARLTREDYCDGLGDCLPACPTGAISFETREAPAYDEAAVQQARQSRAKAPSSCGCPGAQARTLPRAQEAPAAQDVPTAQEAPAAQSELRQWPVQIRLAPAGAPYFDGADLLVAADCTAYACGRFHQDFMRGKITLIGCPKLDATDYAEKLAAIFAAHELRSVTVVRMQVPCCGGIEQAVARAAAASRKPLPMRVAVLSTDGRVVQTRALG